MTLEIGKTLGRRLVPGDVLCLEGELGTGKSVIARGIAIGMGWRGAVPSPSFTIIRLYPDIMFCHVDAFRITNEDELLECGIEEFFGGPWVCAVEWAEKVRRIIPKENVTLRIYYTPVEEERTIYPEFLGSEERWRELREELAKYGCL